MSAPRETILKFLAACRRRVRLRRGLSLGLLAVAVVWLAALFPFAMKLAGATPAFWWSTAALVLTSMGVFLLAALTAAAAPLHPRLVEREADRRLLLDGALLTAVDVIDSTQPMHRLLVRRTATAIRSSALGEALPVRLPAVALLLPALATAAFAVSTQSLPETTGAASGPLAVREVSAELTAALQQAAADLLALDDRTPEAVDAARELLRIDEALRDGEMQVGQIRPRLEELAERLSAADGPDNGPAERGDAVANSAGEIVLSAARISESSVSVVETVATVVETSEPEDDDGAGLGRGTAEPRSSMALPPAAVDATATWSLPASSGARRGDRPGPAGASVSDERTLDAPSERWMRTDEGWTPDERRLVETYFEALARRRSEIRATAHEEQR